MCHPTLTIVRILLYLLYRVSNHLAIHQTTHQIDMYSEGEADDDSKLWSFLKLRYNSPKIDSKGFGQTIMSNYQ